MEPEEVKLKEEKERSYPYSNVRSDDNKGMKQKIASAIFIASIVVGFGFMTPTVTGNAIAGMSIGATNSIGILLFFFGVGGLILTFKKNK